MIVSFNNPATCYRMCRKHNIKCGFTKCTTLNVSGITTLKHKIMIKRNISINNGSPYAFNNYTLIKGV